jgi:hypothetical protein
MYINIIVRLSVKYIFICCLFFLSMASAQTSFPDRETKIQQLKDRTDINVTEIEPGLLKIRYPDGETKIKNTNDFKSPPGNSIKYSPAYDSTIIDLRTLDTIPFYKKYSFWQEVGVGTDNTKAPLVVDINRNGLCEIYSQIKSYTSEFSDNVIMEENSLGGFDSLYSYDSTSVARAIYDINKDGLDEILLHRFPPDTNFQGHSWLFFTQPADTSFATDLSFIFYPFSDYSNQLNNNTFGDWDGDENTDQIFIRDCCPNSIYVYEYNNITNNFDSIYYYDPSQYGSYFAGFAIGDFNQNGKTEFLEGGVNGEVISIENCGDNCYQPIYHGYVDTYNAYLYAATNDIDGNGKPEVWIGGDFFFNGIGYTRIFIFEADGENNYVVVGKIEFIGVFSFYSSNMQVLDVDRDGRPEIMVCIDEHVIILKFTGSTNHQTYSVFYLKRNDLLLAGRDSEFYGATMYDVTGDGKEDIIIHMDDIIHNVGMKLFTFIYKSDLTVNVEEQGNLPGNFELYQNYPNPFNPATTIKFQIPERSDVTLKVYSILGKEIGILINKELSPGNIIFSGMQKINMDTHFQAGSILFVFRLVTSSRQPKPFC